MRGTTHGRVRLLAAVVIALGLYAHAAQAKPTANRAAAVSCIDDEQCQAYCEWKHPGQVVTGVCPSPGSACICYL